MIITFCGHSNCLFNNDVKEQFKNILLDEIIKNPTCKFYLGGYGDFDGLCLRTLKDLNLSIEKVGGFSHRLTYYTIIQNQLLQIRKSRY